MAKAVGVRRKTAIASDQISSSQTKICVKRLVQSQACLSVWSSATGPFRQSLTDVVRKPRDSPASTTSARGWLVSGGTQAAPHHPCEQRLRVTEGVTVPVRQTHSHGVTDRDFSPCFCTQPASALPLANLY